MKNIIIVGGGSAGLTTALIIKKRFNNINLTLIKSAKIGIVGVGEGVENAWDRFCGFVGIDFKEFIRECDATIKFGLKLQNWTKKDYYHVVSQELSTHTKLGQYLGGYGYAISNNINPNKLHYTTLKQDFSNNQSKGYSFNTFKLNSFLQKKCREVGIKIIDDEIKDAVLDKNGIKELIGSKKYKADFFIDSSGFRRVLIGKFRPKWNSYKSYMRLKDAIVFMSEDTKDYNTFVLARALKYGWNFRIPTYGRWGNGYIFDSDYITKDQAHQELEKTYNRKIEIAKHIKFEPGSLENPWIKNCLAVGLSASFCEPLEASAIGNTINQAFMLIHYLIEYNSKSIDQYNKIYNEMMENTRDFILIHYLNKRNDSKFWKDYQHVKFPDSLSYKLEEWKHRLPIEEDMVGTKYKLFWEYNFAHILWNLDYFDKKSIKKQFDALSPWYKDYIKITMDNFLRNKKGNLIKHKDYLTVIRYG
tara:strand:- start:1402 stop:2823 length:1422 start_codon:yes stop_codon:yes gene_type:complete